MDNRNTYKRRSSERSRSTHDTTKPTASTPPPTFLTSFPSFASPDVHKGRRKSATPSDSPTSESTPNRMDKAKAGSRAVSSPESTPSAVNRTVSAAYNLRKTIIDTITNRQTTQHLESSPTLKIFSGLNEGAGDPLAGATDEHVQRIITSSGGSVATVKKYSADLAESNERVAMERNSKLRLVEDNRQLRANLSDKILEIEHAQRQLQVAKQLFARYVTKTTPSFSVSPNLQIIDSPSGPYALEDNSGTILATLSDDFVYPESISSHDTSTSPPENDKVFQDTIIHMIPQKEDSQSTIRARKPSKPPRLPQRLVSSIRSETVELKSPVDMQNLPPALRAITSPKEALVDRLGFYITPDRERRHQEASVHKNDDTSESSSLHSNQKDDDDSSLSASEMLCDAPTGPATKLIFRSESSSSMRVFIEVDKPQETSIMSNPVTQTHAAADITTQSVASSKLAALLHSSSSMSRNNSSTDLQPSQALTSLLFKLNQAYDVQQRRRTTEWTSFYEQSRDLIRAKNPTTNNHSSAAENIGFISTSPLPEQDITGVAALCSASNVSPDIRSSFNNLIRRGVPVSFRREVWLERSGANNIRDSEHYAMLQAQVKELANEDVGVLREIEVDVERTLANNIFFREGVGKDRLRGVLIAFARNNPDVGYSQGLNIIAANLLLMVPAPEDGFALLQVLARDILPTAYYSRDGRISGAALDRDGRVTEAYVSDLFPALHRHLRAKSAPLTMFTPGWYISAFAAALHGEALYRLWDLVFGFCDGRFVLCFALALLRMNRRGLGACRDAEELMSYLGGRMSSAAVSLDVLINETVKMGEKVTSADLKRRRAAVEKALLDAD